MEWKEFLEKLRLHHMSQAGFARQTGQHVTTISRWKGRVGGTASWVPAYFAAYEGRAPGQARALRGRG